MAALEDRHWWFSGTRALAARLLERHAPPPRDALDLGCGTGLTLKLLGEKGYTPTGLDASPLALRHARSASGAPCLRGSADRLPLRDASFGLVTALDVLEHLPDDGAALAEIRRVLMPGGTLLVSVPAHPFLFSAHDRALGHVRRYTQKRLLAALATAGFAVRHVTWANASLFLPIALVRLLRRSPRDPGRDEASDLSLPPRPINAALRALLGAEASLASRAGLPMGLSLFAVAQAPG